jgi:hypothetical protein
MLKIHETTGADGALVPVHLRVEDGALWVVVGDVEAYAVGAAALDAVMKRFGLPLEPAEPITQVAALDLGDGRAVRHVRHLGRYDVIARDFLVVDAPDGEPLCALATTVSGALVHLGRAAAAAR